MSSMEKEICREAILHIPQSQYAFAETENRLVVRIRVKKSDLSECILYYADRVCQTTPITFYEIPMTICAKDEYFEYYEAKVEGEMNRICYYFKLVKGDIWTYYYADRFTQNLTDFYIDDKIVDGRSEYYQYPFILRNEIPDVPDWFKNARVYNIFPDSFANGKRVMKEEGVERYLEDGKVCRSHLGGTIQGITQNLDYIQELGFTCIYLNPIFVGGEYHKYDVLDYYHIDPCMGTEDDFRELVNALHVRGMKIIIDGVFNHCSWEFFAFEDVIEKGEKSRYCKWFYDLAFPVEKPADPMQKPSYACFAYERKMPKLNTADLEVQKYFADVGAYWIREFGVDGWRLDVANEIDRNFWRRFRAAVKNENPQAVLIGEVWENAQTWLRGDAFDSVMNYEFRRICKEYLTTDTTDAKKAAYEFEKMLLRYPTNLVKGQLNLLDSHDVARFFSLCNEDEGKWKLACILLMLMPGVPSLFYGDEKKISGVTEPEYRKSMIWDNTEDFSDFVRKLTQIREKFIDETAGYAPEWELIEEGMFAFCRIQKNHCLRVIMNAGNKKIVSLAKQEDVLFSAGYEDNCLNKNGYIITIQRD